jgi:hypothetical protein
MEDGTAWEEIGGTVPARRESSLPAAISSGGTLEQRLSNIHDLWPVSRDEFYVEVAPCLSLTGGVGMSQADQRAWLEAAYLALEGIPIALLRRGAKAALLKADHPSKIIPTITAEIGEDWRWRREYRPPEPAPPLVEVPRGPRSASALMDARGKPMTDEETEILNAHLESLGSPVRYSSDGSRHELDRKVAR